MPYPNEHSARLKSPDDFDPKSFRRTEGGTIYGRKKVPSTISIIWGKLKGKSAPSDPPIPQALRFPTKDWSADEAKAWLKKNDITYQSFEKAGKGEEAEDIPMVEWSEIEAEIPEDTDVEEGMEHVEGHEIVDVYLAPCLVEKRDDGVYLIGEFAEADKKNGNGRIYPHAVLANAIKKAKKKMIGLDSHFAGNYQSVVFKYTDIWMEDAKAKCRAKIINTRAGQDLQIVAEEGIPIGLSMAGIGEESFDDKKKASIVQDGYVMQRIDAVLDPAFAKAQAIKEEIQKEANKMTEQEIKEMQELKSQISELQSAIAKINEDSKADKSVIDAYKKDLDAKQTKLEAREHVKSLIESDAYKTHPFKSVIEKHLLNYESKVDVDKALPLVLETLNEFKGVQTEAQPSAHIIRIRERGFFGDKGIPTSISEAYGWLLDKFQDTGIWHGSAKMDNPRWQADRLLKNYILANMNNFSWDLLDNGVPDKDIFIESRQNPLYHCTKKGLHEALGDTEAYTADLASTTDFILPIYTLIMKDIMEIINQICAIQPLDRPTGKAFFLQEYYGDGAGAWTEISANFSRTKADKAEGATPQYVKTKLASENISLPNPKKLIAPFTIELEQDLKAYHGMNVDSVHVQLMKNEIAREVAYSILYDMIAGTAFTGTGGGVTASANLVYPTTPPANWSESEWMKAGLTRIFKQASAKIDGDPFNVEPDFAVYHKDWKYLFTEPHFVAEGQKQASSFGFVRQGTYQAEYAIFKTSSADYVDKILLGHRGTTFADAGEIFLPYILFYLGERIPAVNLVASRTCMFRGTWKKVTAKKFMIIEIQ